MFPFRIKVVLAKMYLDRRGARGPATFYNHFIDYDIGDKENSCQCLSDRVRGRGAGLSHIVNGIGSRNERNVCNWYNPAIKKFKPFFAVFSLST